MKKIMKREITKIFILLIFVLVQIHVTLYTADNIFNPLTIMGLIYYDSHLHEICFRYTPNIVVFTYQSLLTFSLLYALFNKRDYKNWITAWAICSLILIMCCYAIGTYYKCIFMIDDTKIGALYYQIYGYGQAFRYILGFLIMQVLLLCVYMITESLKRKKLGTG